MARILVVDDEPQIAETLERVLALDGHEVTSVCDPTLVPQMDLARFDLLLLDVTMPGLDGFELLRRIRGRVDAPVIFLTARVAEQDAVTGLGLGADDYVHHWRYRRLEDGSWLLLAYQNLPQYATRELRDSRPNVLVQLGWTCAGAGAALIVGVGAWAAHVISRKLRPAMGAAERIEAADLDSPVGTSNVRQVNDLLTAMERMRSALRETLDARWRAEEAQREAVASLAHELKTPLTVLSANAELLATGAAEGPDAEAAARAVADAARRLDECASRIMSATLT